MKQIKDILFNLSKSVAIGSVDEAALAAKSLIAPYCEIKETNGLGFYGFIDAKKEKTVMIEAHIDEIGMIVTKVDDNGFVTVSACGGVDIRTLPSRQVIIHADKKYNAVFCSTPPHLIKDEETFENIGDIKLDTGMKNAKDHIKEGDFVTFCSSPASLLGDKVTGKSFDDRAGCTVLALLAQRLYKKALPVNVILQFCDGEELSMRGARCDAFSADCDEAIAIDVSFGNAPDVSPEHCGKLGKGVMIGVSPVLSRKITNTLLNIAETQNIKYQREVMGAATGTDADVISVSKSGIPCGLVSIPLRNMHSEVEIISLSDIEATAALLENYILAGGAK